MRILALDLATRTGWAVWTGTARTSGVRDFSIGAREPRGILYQKFDEWLVEMLNPEPDLVVYEDPGHVRSRPAAAVLYGFVTRLWQAVDRRRIARQEVQIQRLKKWATGSGRADKAAMIGAVCARFYPATHSPEEACPLDDNEADAIALLEYAKAEIVPAEVAW